MGRLVGRDNELSRLREVSARLATGTGECLIIEGPSGIGKSRILGVAKEQARNNGVAVAAGKASMIDRAAPLTTLLTSLRGSDPPILDDLGSVADMSANRFWIVDRIGELLEEFARHQPLMVAIDDLQWCDELSSLALRVLVPQLASSPVGWLLAWRELPTPSTGQELVEQLQVEGNPVMTLGPLTDSQTAAFCEQFLGVEPDTDLVAMATRCGGNPFLLEQLLTGMRAQGRLRVEGTVVRASTLGLPDGFATRLEHRLRELSNDTRRLLEAGSILGRPFNIFEIANVLGEDSTRILPLVAEAERADLLEARGSELAFRHDLLREATYQSISLPVREILHRKAATVLRSDAKSPAEIVQHLVCSGRGGISQVVDVAFQTIDQIASTAPGDAADMLNQVLELLDADHQARPALVVEAVRLLAAVGRLQEARVLGESALRPGLDVATEAAILLGLAESLKHSGQDNAVIEYTGRALEKMGISPADTAKLLAIRAHAMLNTGDIDKVEQTARRGVGEAVASGDHGAHVFCLIALGIVEQSRGNLEAGIEQLRAAVQVAETAGADTVHRHPQLWLGQSLTTVDRLEEAAVVLGRARRETEQLGTAWAQPLYHFGQAELWLARGRLADAQAEAEAGLGKTEQLSAFAMSVPLLGVLVRVAVRSDNLPVARQLLARAKRLMDHGIGSRLEDYALAAAITHHAGGHAELAMDELTTLYDALPGRLLLLTQDTTAGLFLVRVALANDARDTAQKVVTGLTDLADRNPDVPSLAGLAAHARGLVTSDVAQLRRAVDLLGDGPRTLAAAAAYEDTAAAMAAHDSDGRDEARACYDAAFRRYQECGAIADAERVRVRLREVGVNGRRAKLAPTKPAECVGPLTESELRVARLVAQGMTNKEVGNSLFLSRHTVDSHLRHAFTKLGVNSRVSLTRWVLEHDAAARAAVTPQQRL